MLNVYCFLSSLTQSTKQVNRQVVAHNFALSASTAYLDTYLTTSSTFPSSTRARSHLSSNIYILAKQPTLSHCNTVQSVLLLNLVNCRPVIYKISQPHEKYFRCLSNSELLYKITLTYVTFAAICSGQFCVTAVDCDRYVIL